MTSEKSGSATVVPPAVAPPTGESAGWQGILDALKLGGMVRELAHHCELVTLSEGAMVLRLNPAHKSLLLKATQDKLQTALSTHLGRPLKLSIEIGNLNGETPAQRSASEKADRHTRAIEALEQDTFVRDVIETFDATISEQSIKPL